MSFSELIINVSPSTAVRKCGSLIEATSKICLEGLKAKHGFELPEEYVERMTRIRDSLTTYENEPKAKKRRIDCTANEMGEPPESFRELSILPTPEELIADRPFLRPNVVKGAYVDKEHYLDVQFRLLREDCFGPLREGIHQFIKEPNKKKYDHIRVYRNVKFLEPFVSNQKIGSLVLLDENTMKRFKNIEWAHSKRFLFGSLVLFTNDNCKSFLIGTILDRDEKYLSKRQLAVSLVDTGTELKIYNDDSYTMIECEVYFEPYYHVLKALQDPNFPEHLAMSSYIIDVQKMPEKPAYLSPDTVFSVLTEENMTCDVTVLEEETWPSETTLGLNSTQYEAYKLALTHEFAVIQGPPGTGKTFLGVKIAQTLLRNLNIRILVICYTNHALDQFLEALLPVTKSMVRIGGRSRNEALQKFNINEIRRQNDIWFSNFHDKRINLKMEMGELKRAQARLDELMYASVLSCKSIVEHVEECKIIENFYRGSGIEDPLYHWLFEDMDNIEFEPLVEANHILEYDASSGINENRDVDDDNRNDVIFDDLDVHDHEVHMRDFPLVETSFTISDAKENVKKLFKMLEQLQTKGPAHKNKCDLRGEICHIFSQMKRLKDMMAYRTRAPKINLRYVQDITNVPLIERWSLYFKWTEVVLLDFKKIIKMQEKKVKSAAEAYDEARMIVDLAVLKKAEVVGMTTSGAARLRKLMAEIETPIVVVEEAAEVLEAHIVTSLTKHCQHLILIGDHQQLRPSAAYMRLARHYELEVSLFERMIRNGVHSRRLGVQHRMRPELAALVCPHIYEDLRNHPSVEEFPPVKGLVNNLFFFTHDHPEQCDDDSSSRTNTFEGDMALRLANYLMQQGYQPQDVTILAAYSGQMFYLRKQRFLYHHLKNVKITVLDNYQGEESKIIVLSLVRNNTHDSIGFLGTENRICVALSRAREGFYMFGNIDLLKKNSPLWSNIEATLAQNGSVGKYLELICSNHNDNITKVETIDDFLKVPEGGCLLGCKGTLPCEHPCPRVCHGYDREHTDIICTSQTCNRKICEVEGHSCPLACGKECRPCGRSVEKSLPCGHSKVLACHMDPSASTVQCSIVITVTLPNCGHEVEKQCSKKLEDVRCTKDCQNNRLDCGHVCRRKCHVKDDPEHKRYTCMQQCPKPKKGCTANLEDDPGAHKCLRSCFEPCINCNVQVVKKRSSCKHKSKVECHKNVDATPCREKCARSLPCTHFCKKLCFEKCGDCKQKVKKIIPECGHEIEIDCGIVPTREHCMRKCERVMACGHVCPGRCDQPCDKSKCTKIMERNFDSPCGHEVQLPCDVLRSMRNDVIDPEKLLEHCTALCGATLRCGHKCSGTCAGCRQGRLHAPCAAVCQQLNICGHRCEEPCSQVCPPVPQTL
ncbi:NFX1-type zinc finger-containing protein 1-like [Choristoneura fumiferana]|uniref:NFX1-type zinc finger-containing protein 1-like n=1 Tax=Choristoneura fumiferana TaxID=7141 RepID=UPI003D15E995